MARWGAPRSAASASEMLFGSPCVGLRHQTPARLAYLQQSLGLGISPLRVGGSTWPESARASSSPISCIPGGSFAKRRRRTRHAIRTSQAPYAGPDRNLSMRGGLFPVLPLAKIEDGSWQLHRPIAGPLEALRHAPIVQRFKGVRIYTTPDALKQSE